MSHQPIGRSLPMRRFIQVSILASALLLSAFITNRATGSNDASAATMAGATFEVYKDNAGEYRWRLRATNTQVIATSGEGYKEKKSAMDAIESVKKNAADAPVKEMEMQ